MTTPQERSTRGDGALEDFLGRRRSRLADGLIPAQWRTGRVLDIGCGVHPQFLLHTEFGEKHALDKLTTPEYGGRYREEKIALIHCDIETETRRPYDDDCFDVVTMLAVVEHLRLMRLIPIMMEVHRILKPGRKYILTTPPLWTRLLLRLMARLGLVSPEEIREHKYAYSSAIIRSALQEAGFPEGNIRVGYFELGMNMWASAAK